jgi:hypothetical protein
LACAIAIAATPVVALATDRPGTGRCLPAVTPETADHIAERRAGAGAAPIDLFVVDRAGTVVAADISTIAAADMDGTATVAVAPYNADVIGAGVQVAALRCSGEGVDVHIDSSVVIRAM